MFIQLRNTRINTNRIAFYEKWIEHLHIVMVYFSGLEGDYSMIVLEDEKQADELISVLDALLLETK